MMKKIMVWMAKAIMEACTCVTVFFVGALFVNAWLDGVVDYSISDGEWWCGFILTAVYMISRYQVTRLVKYYMANTKEEES
jgi:hypothetical protein